jgi:[protein-PII] uridylyltransferase
MAMMAIASARTDVLRRPDLTGSGRRSALTETTDAWLAEVFSDAARHVSARAALIAVGGHGRKELAPGSDIDVVLIHRGAEDQAATLAERMWYPIWDAGLPLDHSVRTVAEARRIAASDMKALLGLLDARLIAGDEQIARQVRDAVLTDWRAMARHRISDLRGLVDQRRERWGDMAHMLEPNLKEAYGGLRETTVLRGVAASWLTDIDHTSWPMAADFLLNVRDELHLATQSRSDVLHLQEQSIVAERMGLSCDDDLLRQVYESARTIAYASDHMWQRIHRLTWSAPSRSPRHIHRASPQRVPLADGVVMQGGEIVLAADADPHLDPELVLRVAACAAQTGIPISMHTMSRLRDESAPLPNPWPRSAREAFVTLLGSGPALAHIWEGFDQAGIIERLIPGWHVVRSAPQRNAMHRFTVDRHLIETVSQCQTRAVRRPDLLLIGALLHDFGKARTGDHSVVGAGLAAEIAPMMGFDASDTATIVTLVRHHLLLPTIATKRDLDDPATIQEVLQSVPEVGDIELLTELSRADALATGPSVSSDWRLGLVATLGRRAMAVATGDTEITPPRLSDDENFALQHPGLWVLVTQQRDWCEVSVAAPDAPGLLATVAAVLTARNLQIRGARVDTKEKRALQRWQAVPLFGEPPTGEELLNDLRRALDGAYDPVARLQAREQSAPAKQAEPARVFVTNPNSGGRTLIEVRSPDRPGLLHAIAQHLSSVGLDISGAKVDTLGADVVDVFFVTDQRGQQLDPDVVPAVKISLLEALGAAS